MHKSFTVDFEPFPQARPRLHKSGFAYDPSKKKKEALSLLIKQQWNEDPISSAIDMRVKFFMKLPKSLSKKKKAELEGNPHITRCDLDNALKAVWDAMNGIVFQDDCLIYKIMAEKYHSNEPRIEVDVFY